MKKLLILLFITFFFSTNIFAKALDQKNELKKIYEAGGISKVEYEKAIEFLENPEKNKKKKMFFNEKKDNVSKKISKIMKVKKKSTLKNRKIR